MAYTTINKSTDYFNTLTYSGNGSNPRTLTGVGFQPDWVWLKNRTDGNGHTLADAVRGANKTISSDGTDAEITDKSDGHLDAFTSDGFTVGAGSSGDARVNDGSHTYVAWNWKANGTGVSNTDGSITSTVSANTTSGFSIVSYTGTGANATVGHGLGVTPKVVIVKDRDSNENWQVYHGSISGMSGCYITLNNNDRFLTNITNFWNGNHSSTIIDIGSNNGTNQSTNNLIAYCFAEKKGYSKFGTYTGHGNADGAFVHTGLKPSFVMVKNTSADENWIIFDNKRPGRNLTDALLKPSLSNAESTTGVKFDLLSNGFKARVSDAEGNSSGDTFIYMAFAEHPFVSSTGTPTTAG